VPLGVLLPLFSEGGAWAFDFAVAIRRRRDPDAPVWHMQCGIAVFAGFGAVLNFLHGMTPGTPHHGLTTAFMMALVSAAGVIAHQLIVAGPRRGRAERYRARLGRLVARREHNARMAAARRARVMLDELGGAALVYRAGTARLTRLPVGRPWLYGFRSAPVTVLKGEPVQDTHLRTDPESVRKETVREDICAPAQGEAPGEPVRAAEPRTVAASPEPVREEPRTEIPAQARSRTEGPSGDDVSRAEIVAELVEELRAAVRAGKRWTPDHQALMDRTGFGRSWCEKVARDARRWVMEHPDPDDAGSEAAGRAGAARTEETRTGSAGETRPGRTENARPTRTDAEPRTDSDPYGPADRTGSGPDSAARTDAGGQARTDEDARTGELAGVA
jgi:hypothetical protein